MSNNEIRTLSADELEEVAGAARRVIIVVGTCTSPRPPPSIDGMPVVFYNPWLTPGSPEREGTGTTFPI